VATGSSRYQQLNNAVVQLICQLYADQEFEQLTKIGISFDAAEKLIDQDQLVIHQLANYKAPLTLLQINQEVISNLLDHFKRESNMDHLINNLIIHGAPSEMIVSNWNVDSREYFRRKKSLELQHDFGPGRLPKHLKEKDVIIVNRYMSIYRKSALKDAGERLLNSSIQTSTPLYLVWVYMKEYLGNTNIGEDAWKRLMAKQVLICP